MGEKTSFLNFPELQLTSKRKTKIFWVTTKNGEDALGKVKWYGAWRKYCFFPFANTVFDQNCLNEISIFLETETKKHKESLKNGRKETV